jgi:parvulin-like peptidyl-prolyl isomerase
MRSLVATILLSLSLSLAGSAGAADAARVNGRAIPAGAVELELSREPQLRYHPNVTAEKLVVYRKAALERLVQHELFYPEAARRGLAPDAATVATVVARAEKSSGGRDKFDKALAENGLTLTAYQDWARKALAYDALTARLKAEVAVSAADVAAHYQAHITEYVQPERAEADMLYFPVSPYATTAEVEAAQVTAATAAARWRAEKPRDELAFARSAGGQYRGMGEVHRGAAIEALDAQIFKLKSGEISAPVRTIYGWHVLRVTAVKPARQLPLDEAAAGIRAKLVQQRGDEAVKNLESELRAKAKIEIQN